MGGDFVSWWYDNWEFLLGPIKEPDCDIILRRHIFDERVKRCDVLFMTNSVQPAVEG